MGGGIDGGMGALVMKVDIGGDFYTFIKQLSIILQVRVL